MRKYREEIIPIPEDGEFYLETKYADDCDFISHHTPDNNFITETLLPAHLAKYNLKMNPDKTEKTEILPSGSRAINVKKLGSKIGDSADLSYRVQQSNAAFATMWKIWLSNKQIALATRIRLYNACVKSVLTYNLAALGLTNRQANLLDTTHRKQLRKIL